MGGIQKPSPSYTYARLEPGFIRLLELEPAARISDPIRCSLRTVSLGQAPNYEAISYVWGEATPAKLVEIAVTEVGITSNLFDVLVSTRRQDSVRTLWVDALCINQEDMEERCAQVSIMGHIYQDAIGVVICLGKEWDGLDIACEYLEYAAQHEDAHFVPSLEPHLEVRGQDISTPHLREQLLRFFSSPWFSRVWTVQEFVLARKTTFICGPTVVDGQILEQGLSNIRRHVQDRCCGPYSVLACGEAFLDAIAQMDALKSMRTSPRTTAFLETLHHCRRRECSNPRDKIYGMLGMEFRGPASRLEPDYDVPVEQLFVDVAREQVAMTRALDVLSCVGPRGKTALNLPSWVPNWTLTAGSIFTHHVSVDHLMTLPHYNAAGGAPADFRVGTESRAITKGVRIDRIKMLGRACFFSDLASCASVKDFVAEARALAGLPCLPPKSYEEASPQELEFWRTICGNLAVEVKDESRDWRTADPVVDYESYLEWSGVVEAVPDAEVQLDSKQAFEDAAVATFSARMFMRTRQGRFGMVAPDSRRGDLVMVLAGGKVPYILREEPGDDAEDGVVTYSFVGDAYVDGCMHGEGIGKGPEWAWLSLV